MGIFESYLSQVRRIHTFGSTTAGFAQSTVPDQYDVSYRAGGPQNQWALVLPKVCSSRPRGSSGPPIDPKEAAQPARAARPSKRAPGNRPFLLNVPANA